MRKSVIHPLGWARPKGYANGVVAEGKLLFVAGQVGWDPKSGKAVFPRSFVDQFDCALANVLAVIREAGGRPSDLVRCTIYVCDKDEYVSSLREVGKIWKKRVGRHYPAMSLVQVASLLEEDAKVEIEATAVL